MCHLKGKETYDSFSHTLDESEDSENCWIRVLKQGWKEGLVERVRGMGSYDEVFWWLFSVCETYKSQFTDFLKISIGKTEDLNPLNRFLAPSPPPDLLEVELHLAVDYPKVPFGRM